MSDWSWPPPGTPLPRPRPGDDYRSPVRLVRLLFWAVAVGMLVVVAVAAAGYAGLRTFDQELANPGTVTASQLTDANNWCQAATVAALLILLVWFGLLVAWTRRLYRNLGPLGFRELRFSEGWAFGGWFVPFLNLVRPKQIVDDLWRAGDPTPLPGQAVEGRPVSGLLHWWWGLWIALLVMSSCLGSGAENLRERSTRGGNVVWAAIIELAFGALTLLVVVRTTARQTRLAGDDAPGHHDDRVVVAVLAGVGAAAVMATLAVNVFLWVNLPDGAAASVVVGTAPGTAPGRLPLDDVRPGQCFDDPARGAAEIDVVSVDHLDLVSCGTLHDNEVFAVVEHPAPAPPQCAPALRREVPQLDGT